MEQSDNCTKDYVEVSSADPTRGTVCIAAFSGGASAVKEPGHFEVRKSSS